MASTPSATESLPPSLSTSPSPTPTAQVVIATLVDSGEPMDLYLVLSPEVNHHVQVNWSRPATVYIACDAPLVSNLQLLVTGTEPACVTCPMEAAAVGAWVDGAFHYAVRYTVTADDVASYRTVFYVRVMTTSEWDIRINIAAEDASAFAALAAQATSTNSSNDSANSGSGASPLSLSRSAINGIVAGSIGAASAVVIAVIRVLRQRHLAHQQVAQELDAADAAVAARARPNHGGGGDGGASYVIRSGALPEPPLRMAPLPPPPPIGTLAVTANGALDAGTALRHSMYGGGWRLTTGTAPTFAPTIVPGDVAVGGLSGSAAVVSDSRGEATAVYTNAFYRASSRLRMAGGSQAGARLDEGAAPAAVLTSTDARIAGSALTRLML